MPSQKTKITKNLEKRELIVERDLSAPRQLVWDGWTKPEHVAQWWGPKGWTTTIYTMDVRPGGVWHYCMRPDDGDGQESWGRAVYEQVDKPSLLVYDDAFSDEAGNDVAGSEMRTTVDFDDHDGGTRLVIRTIFATSEELESAEAKGMVEGFIETFDRLEEYLSAINN